MKISLPVFLIVILALFAGCTQKGDFSSASCVNNNANCDTPATSVNFQGGENNFTNVSLGNNGDLGSLKIKTVRYGEQILVEFVVTNPKLNPLTFSSKNISPNDAAFSDGVAKSAKACQNSTLLYSQSCSIAILYKPDDPPPGAQTLQLKFKTFLGEDFIINTAFDPNSLLADFYIDPTKLALPDTLVHASGAPTPVSFQFQLENHGQDTLGNPLDLTGISYQLKPGSACILSDGITNPCSSVATLPGLGGSCELTLSYKPTVKGPQTCDLLVSSDQGITQTLSFQGTSYQWQSQIMNLDFGTSNDSSPIIKTVSFTLPNTSASASNCTFAGISGADAGRFSATPGGSCTSTTAGGTTCDVNVQWNPPAGNADNQAVLSLSCDTRGGNTKIYMHARKTSSKILVSTNQADFGIALAGTSATQTVTFTNSDVIALSNFQVALQNLVGSTFTVQSSTCSSTLSAGASCDVVGRFASPLSSGAAYSASLSVNSNESSLDTNVALVAQSQPLRVSTPLFDFGYVVPGKDRPSYALLISNPSATVASGCELKSSTLAAQNFLIDYDSTCPGKTSLNHGESCLIKAHYSPRTAAVNQASLQFVCQVGGTASITLSGNSQTDLRLTTLPPSKVDKKNRLVGTTQDFEFILGNFDGAQDVPGLSISLPTPPTGWSLISAGSDDCSALVGATLTHGAQCKVKVRFQPSATAGSEEAGVSSGSLTLASSDSTVSLPTLSFSSEAKTVLSSASNYDWGTVSTGADKISKTFVFSNPSNVDDATSCSLSVSGSFTLTNNTCLNVLKKASSCSTQITLPSQSASADLNENLDYTCGVGGRARVAVHAYVQKPPTLTLTGSTNFNYVDIGQSQTLSLTLTHTGVALDDSAKSVLTSLTNTPEFQITSNNCPTLLAPGASCTINATWTPSLAGIRNATLSIEGSNFSTVTTSFSGEAIDPNSRLVPSPSSLSFLGHLLGSHTEQVITFTNNASNGTSAALVTGALSQGVPWTLSNDLCNGQTLATAATCTLKVNYDPTAVGATSGQFTVTAGGVSKTISYAGAAEQITNSVSSIYSFGDVDVGAPMTSPALTISNPSSLDNATTCNYSIDAPFIIDGSSTCGATINQGASCALKITLPTQMSGSSISGKKVNVDCGVGGHTEIALSAEVKELPKLVWTGTSNFGEQDINTTDFLTQTYTLTNPKSYAVDLTSFSLVGSDSSFSLSGGTCTSSLQLAPSASCTAIVKFAPTTLGAKTIKIRAGATLPNPYNNDLTLTAVGTQMLLTLSTPTLSFTPVELGFSGPKDSLPVTITNNGTRTANLVFSGLTNPPFGLVPGACASIAQGASCIVNVQSYADSAPGIHSQTLTLTETQNTHSLVKTVAIDGSTVPVASLSIKDTRAQSSYTTTITTTDITGPTDDANNIINLSPATRTVTYTLQNSASGSGDIDTFAVNLAYQSGANGTLTLASDTCTGATLASLATCTFNIVYTPTTNNENSNYSLTVTAKSKLSGNILTVSVTNLIAHSIRGVSLAANQNSLVFGPTKTTLTASSTAVTLTNNGDQTATSLDLTQFTGTNASVFSIAGGSTCGASLAGHASCQFNIQFAPGSKAATFVVNHDIKSTQQTVTSAIALKAASFNENANIGTAKYGLEPDATADTSKYYFASRSTDGSTYSRPVITICNQTSEGAVDQASCQASEIYDGTRSYFAGLRGGSGPRILQQGNKLFVALQNQENDSSAGNYGDSTVLVCMKPDSGLFLSLADCAVLKPHTSANIGKTGAGLFPSMAISGSKIAIGNQTHTGYIITVCNIDSVGTDPETGIDVSSCKAFENAALADNNALYTALAFNGSQIVFASFTQASSRVLMGVACSVNGTNDLTCSANSVIDNQSTTVGSDSFEPGVYPSIVLDGSRFYVAHQAGENIFKVLRLSSCTLSSATAFTCSSQVAAQSADSSGVGLMPSLVLSGTGVGARLWLTSVTTTDYGSSISGPRYQVLQCTTTAGAPTCAGSPYLTQATSANPAVVYSRRSYFNNTSKMLIIPYTGTSQRLGVANIGLTPEL